MLVRLALLTFLAAAVHGQVPPPTERDYVIHDFRFTSGETMPELHLHYATLGTPRRDDSGVVRNAVLVLHGTGGSFKQFINDRFAGVLFAPGGLLDANKYYIVIPDNIGHGQSSKPSDGLYAHFPHYDYDDMTELQRRLVVDALGVHHLRLILGTSMGAMHAWVWGERWPDMMDGLVPLASLPAAIAGRNRIWRKMMIDDITSDPEWNGGEYKEQPRGLAAAVQILLIAGSAPLQWQASAPTRDDADKWLADQMKTRLATNDANDLLYALEASRNYDPSPNLERITAPLLAINSADDFINPPELGIMEKLMPRVKRGKYVLLPTTKETHGHSTHTWAAVWKGYLADFLAALK